MSISITLLLLMLLHNVLGLKLAVVFFLGTFSREKKLLFFWILSLVAGAWTERKKMYHGGSFLKLADDNMDIQNPEAQNRAISGF